MNTVCVNPGIHGLSVGFFNASMVFHYTVVAYHVGRETKVAELIRLMLLIAVVGIVFSSLYPWDYTTWFGQYTFFLCECTGLCMGFGIVPVCCLFGKRVPRHTVTKQERIQMSAA